MRFINQYTQIKAKRWVEITDGPVLKDEWSSVGRRFRVERVEIEYHLKNGEWTIDFPSSAQLIGTVLKKDGTDSVNSVVRNARRNWHRDRNIHPWLSEIADLLRPTGGVETRHVVGLEVT